MNQDLVVVLELLRLGRDPAGSHREPEKGMAPSTAWRTASLIGGLRASDWRSSSRIGIMLPSSGPTRGRSTGTACRSPSYGGRPGAGFPPAHTFVTPTKVGVQDCPGAGFPPARE